jgi:hypothetical protein
VRLSSLDTQATSGPIVPAPDDDDDDDEYRAASGMIVSGENRSTRRKPASVPLCPPQISHNLSRDGTQAAAVVSL